MQGWRGRKPAPANTRVYGPMTRLRREYYRKKLNGLLAKADDEAFFVMMWATSALQSGRPERAKRFLTFPSQAATSDISSPFAVHAWVRETLLNEVLTIPKLSRQKGRRIRQLDCGTFRAVAAVANALRELENAEDGLTLERVSVLQEMHRLAQRQFEWQRGFVSYPQLYRAGILYGGERARSFFSANYGFTLDEFSLSCFALRAILLNSPAVMRGNNMDYIGISKDKLDAVFGLIAITHLEARRMAYELRLGGGHIGYKRSVLRQYPCVAFGEVGERVHAPLPDLITLRATSGLFYDFVKASDDARNEISGNFEKYCRDLLRTMLPSFGVTGSVKYGRKNSQIDSPDILIRDNNSILMVLECKATRLTFEARFSEHPLDDAKRGYEEMAKGVFQIWRFVSHHRRGLLHQERLAQDAKGVVLTLDTWLSMAETMQSNVLDMARTISEERDPNISVVDQIPIIFCSIDDLEQTLCAGTELSFFQAIQAATQEEFHGWKLWRVHEEVAQEVIGENHYPFVDRVSEVLPWWTTVRAIARPS